VTTVIGPPLISAGIGWDWAGWTGWAVFFAALGLVALRVPGPPVRPRREQAVAAAV
jgi:hypothetical protein